MMTDDQQPNLPLPEDAELAADAERQREWLRALHLAKSKRQMADYLPGGAKYTGALYADKQPTEDAS